MTTDDLILAHLGLADTIAHRFARRGQDEDDLRQVARTGLVEAARRFDPERGEFWPFAVVTITGSVRRHFRDYGWLVRPPRQTQDLLLALRSAWSDLVQALGSEPTNRQLAERLGVEPDEIDAAQQAGRGYRSVSNDLPESTPAAVVSTDEWSRIDARLTAAQVLRPLADDERRLLYLRFVEERTQVEIAGILGVSQMQVSRRLSRLLARLCDLSDESAQIRLQHRVGV